MRIIVTALAMAVAASASLSIPAAQAGQSGLQPQNAAPSGSCTFKKTEFSASTANQNTTSTTFTNVGDGGSITFTQKKSGCVAGTFFGNVGNTTTGDNVHMQIQLDGNNCAPLTTGDYVFANADVDLSSHAVAFFCGVSVPAGSHTIQVQWSAAAGEAEMFQHTLEVNHS